jgi:fumarate reductase iron-sulfur subunit
MNDGLISISVARQNSSEESAAKILVYKVPKQKQMSVIDALEYIREHLDPSLSFNYSCKKQRCGSCAMKIDDSVALGCYTPATDGQTILPLPGFRVEKDLIVDWSPHEAKMQALTPNLVYGNPKVAPKGDIDLADSAMTCIKCYCCVGACPSVSLTETGFAGPAASVMLASYLDRSDAELAEASLNAHLEGCTRCFACNKVCPAGINIVGSIDRLQRQSGEKNPHGRNLFEMTHGLF